MTHSSGAKAPAPAVNSTAYTTALAQFDAIAERIKLEEGIRSYLRSSRLDFIVHFPVRMDD